MWYHHLIEYFLKEGYTNDLIFSCINMKRSKNEFGVIVVYIDDINIVEIPNEITNAIDSLKKEFEMKDLRRTKFCFELQIEYLYKSVFIHQEAYIMKVLKRFYMEKSYSLCTSMVVRSLDIDKTPF